MAPFDVSTAARGWMEAAGREASVEDDRALEAGLIRPTLELGGEHLLGLKRPSLSRAGTWNETVSDRRKEATSNRPGVERAPSVTMAKQWYSREC
jgi:hypothetical protein